MIKFFHIADTHFGVENYGKIDLHTGVHTRIADFDASLDFCISKAIYDDIDFFLFCGDAYKTATPTPTQQKFFVKQMLRLQSAKIPVVIVIGNHDNPISFGKTHSLDVFSYLPVDGFYVFSKPGFLTLKTKHGDIQIVGIPWPNRTNLLSNESYRFKSNSEIITQLSEKVGQIISGLAKQLDPKLPSILAAHLTVSSGVFSGSEKSAIFGNDPIFLPSQLAIKPFNYVALGHLHKHQNLNKAGIPVVYSGSIDRIDFGERKETKGFCSVEINKLNNDVECKYVFVESPTRPMIQIEVKLDHDKDFTKQIIAAIEKYDILGAIVKIIYYLPEAKNDGVDFFSIHTACNKAYHLASITPIFQQTQRERRTDISLDMNFEQLLTKYFDSKEFSNEHRESLFKKINILQNQINEQIDTES